MKCLNCNKEVKKKNKYCSNICQKEYRDKGANLNKGRKSRNKYN